MNIPLSTRSLDQSIVMVMRWNSIKTEFSSSLKRIQNTDWKFIKLKRIFEELVRKEREFSLQFQVNQSTFKEDGFKMIEKKGEFYISKESNLIPLSDFQTITKEENKIILSNPKRYFLAKSYEMLLTF